MKLKSIIIICCLGFICLNPISAQLHYKVYDLPNGTKTDSLKFGDEMYTPIGLPFSRFCMESWEGGLNFWVPWPRANYGNYKMYINRFGKVSIGKKGLEGSNDPSLNVAGNIRISGNFYLITRKNHTNLSQVNYTTPVSHIYERIMNLSGKCYTKRYDSQLKINNVEEDNFIKKYGEIKYNTTKLITEYKNVNPEIGFIAQDVKVILPEIVTEDSEGYLSINYANLIPAIFESLKYQKNRIEKIEENVALLESINYKKNLVHLNIVNNTKMLTIEYEKKTDTPCLLAIYNTKGVRIEEFILKDKKNTLQINTYDYIDKIYIYTVFCNGDKIINGLINI